MVDLVGPWLILQSFLLGQFSLFFCLCFSPSYECSFSMDIGFFSIRLYECCFLVKAN